MALTCVNCNQPVEQNDAKFFHGVFLCSTCFTMADRMYERARKELTGLLVMLKEGIRIALCDGRLHFAEKQAGEEPTKKEVLEAVLKLQEMKEQREQRPGGKKLDP